jgi:hypothetical protein
MNPYLEQDDAWHDFHERFLPVAAELIAAQVDPRYIVKIDEHVYVHELSAEQRGFLGRADVAVTRSASTTPAATGTTLAAPIRVRFVQDVDTVGQSYLEVRDRHTRKVVTVVELLSPANKQPGPDREQYLAKRLRFLHSAVHLVEIDLLRGGDRLPPADATACAYCVLVSRMQERPEAGLWPLALRERLPVIPVPLTSPDPDARLDLQEVIHRVYDAAHYGTYIYAAEPNPPLSAEDAAWARALVPGLA